MIPKETVSKIIETARIEDVVGDFISLKKRGANLLGLCPFHNEKTPSFTVSPSKDIYKCFGCGKAGNAVGFIMEHEQASFPEALRYLARKYNIEVEEEEQTAEQIQASNKRESLLIVTEFASKYFQEELQTDKGKAVALSYFHERGFRDESIEKFQLGFNPDEWTAFTDAALEKGYNLEYLEETGLSIVKGEKKFDRFKGRVIFPIQDISGRVLGFGGRILTSDKKAAKYLNSPESELYHKSKVLYGLYFAKKAIVEKDNCYLVEGYTDVISFHQNGIENTVSSSGTSLTEEQIRLVKRYCQNITILFDGDAAGIKASFRGIDMILQEGMNVKIVAFEEGADPDSFAQSHSSTELEEFLQKNAQDFIRFKTSLLLDEVGDDPIKKAGLIKEIVSSIALIPDAIKRTLYVQECSDLLDIGEQPLMSELNQILRSNFRKKQQFAQQQEETDSLDLEYGEIAQKQVGKEEYLGEFQERDIVRLLINYANNKVTFHDEPTEEELKRDKKAKGAEHEMLISEMIIGEIMNDELEFTDKTYAEIFNIYVRAYENGELVDEKELIHHSDVRISQISIDLLSHNYILSPNWEERHNILTETEEMKLKDAVLHAIHSLKLEHVKKMIKKIQEDVREKEDEDEIALLLHQQIQLNQAKRAIAKELGRIVLK